MRYDAIEAGFWLLDATNADLSSYRASSIQHLIRRWSRKTVHFIGLLLLTFLTSSVAAQAQPWQEQNGLVVIEAEHIDLVGDWVVENSHAGYTGSGFIRWNGPNYFGTPGNGVIAIPFEVNSSGDYFVKLRMSHKGAPAGDQWNDVWMKMNDNGTFVKAVHPSTYMNDGFTFHTTLEPSGGVFAPPKYNLQAGRHTLYLSGRSFNLRLDRIHIYKSGTPDPENPNSPESSRGGGGGGSATYSLTVASGTGSGSYTQSTVVSISANAPVAGQQFDRWTGSTDHVADIFSPQTTVTMPAFGISVTATYTSNTLREPENPSNTQAGIFYEYYHGYYDRLPDFNTLTPVATGVSTTFTISHRQQEDEFLFRYTGFVDAPSDGSYTFYTASDDGSQLFIGNTMVVDNDSIQSVQERSGTIGLKAGKHAITVTYFERTGDDAFTVSWQGPGFGKVEIPASSLFHGGGPGSGDQLGDVSMNGQISAQDAAEVLGHVIGKKTLDNQALTRADVTGDGTVSAFDAAMILHFVVDLIDCFPAAAGCGESAGKWASSF